MFNATFYPTPHSLAEKMALLVDTGKVSTVLEPSAGKADLLRPIAKRLQFATGHYGRNKNDVFRGLDIDTIELEPDLRSILEGHGLRVVHDDFLTFHSAKQYDLIIMNPPFSAGAPHALRAIKLLQENGGGQLVCLLNAETLRNEATNARRELSQILAQLGARVEFIDNAFSDAERSAKVDCALIYANIPGRAPVSVTFDGMRKNAIEQAQAESSTALMPNDAERQLLQQYKIEAQAGRYIMSEYAATLPYLSGSDNRPIIQLSIKGDRYTPQDYNEFWRQLNKKYWKLLFTNDSFMALFTSNIVDAFQNRRQELAAYAFTPYNIHTLKIAMLAQLVQGVEDTIIALFDEMIKHNMDAGTHNIHYYNGWKTNKGWRVGEKVILPLDGHSVQDSTPVVRRLSDIEKVFNYLDGNRTREIDINKRLASAKVHGQNKDIDTKYFKVTFYKKGTTHFTFKDTELLKKFNIFGGQRKKWLPPTYGTKAYEDMTHEEKSVVDSFEGAAKYAQTMQNPAFYLYSAKAQIGLLSKGD